MSLNWRRLFGMETPPEAFTGRLAPDERVLASAPLADGSGVVVLTPLGLWLPEGRRVGWHLISRAGWAGGTLTVTEAQESVELHAEPNPSGSGAEAMAPAVDAVLLVDKAPLRLNLGDPGRVPEVVHRRVTGSIRARHRMELPGGGAWLLRRAVPGRDGVVLQVRADPDTDVAALRHALPGAAASLRETAG